MKKIFLSLVISIFIISLSYGEYVMKWTNRYDGGLEDQAHAIAVDLSGNVFITGVKYNGSDYDYCTIKYHYSGFALWTNYYDSGGNDDASGIAVDSLGNVYITGDNQVATSCTIKYNISGSAVWTNISGGSIDELAVDSSGNVYITGMRFNGANGSDDYYIIKINSSSGGTLWDKFYGGDGEDAALGVAVDSSENVYVTGRFNNGANEDYCTIKYNASGSAVWTNFYDGGGSDAAMGVAVATNFNPDRVYVTGFSYNGPNNDYFTYGIPPQKGSANFTGVALSPTSICWSWTDQSDDEAGFQIQDPAHNIKGNVGVNITVWTETGLSPNTSYTRHCIATNELGKSYDSNQDIVITLMLPPLPSPPIWISATAVSTNQINLLWKDVSNETSYTLFRNETNSLGSAIKINGTSAHETNYNDATLVADIKYYYWLKAYNITGESGYSSMISNTTQPQAPQPPQWISATAISTEQINLLWNDLSNETSYTLFRDTDNNPTGAVKIGLLANQTNYNDIGLLVNTKYSYWLKAYNITGESGFSSIISNTTLPSDKTPPSEITTLKISCLPSEKGVILTWKNPTEIDFAGIIIVRKVGDYPKNVNDGVKITINNNLTTSYEDNQLGKETHYYYKIYTFDDKGNISSGVTTDIKTLSGLTKNQFKVKKSAINLNNGDVMELEYNAEQGAEVYFEIYTLTGTLVKKIRAQDYRGHWQGKNKKNKDVASGFYFVMMRVNGRIVNKKPIKIGVIK